MNAMEAGLHYSVFCRIRSFLEGEIVKTRDRYPKLEPNALKWLALKRSLLQGVRGAQLEAKFVASLTYLGARLIEAYCLLIYNDILN
jgi:hypothetical protein